MNYRHQFHAGNFADVMKHVLLLQLIGAMQQKPKGFLYLDTHAGRGRYDLHAAAVGDSLARKPEWPEGIGRLWSAPSAPPVVVEYLDAVRAFDRRCGNLGPEVRFYPGSPWLAQQKLRPVDRAAFCEKHLAECSALRAELGAAPRVAVHDLDGYVAVRAMLPPPERRALVLIDPPFEAPNEFTQIAAALEEGLERFPSAVLAVWYPLTERARVNTFMTVVRELHPPATAVAELTIAGDNAPLKMRGCGLMVINPPWQWHREAEMALAFLSGPLAQAPGGGHRMEWLVPES